MDTKRAIIYIDGYNLYRGIAKRLDCKWVDLQAVFEKAFKDWDVTRVNFFTAMSLDRESRLRQQIYIDALETRPKVKVILGAYRLGDVECDVPLCEHVGDKRFKVPKEKRTDVNLASEMLSDAYERNCEVQVLVSGDSDYLGAIEKIMGLAVRPKVVVLVPSLGRDVEEDGSRVSGPLREACDSAGDLWVDKLIQNQFPEIIVREDERQIKMPRTWRIASVRDWERIKKRAMDKSPD